jgi:transposase
MNWIQHQVRFDQPAQDYTRLDYLHEVQHANDRVGRLGEAILEAVKQAPAPMQHVIHALQALRGIAQLSAVTIVSELGQISRFTGARQLMGYSGVVPSENSSGKRIQRGSITKTGKCPPAPGVNRSRLGLPTPARSWAHSAQATARSQPRG